MFGTGHSHAISEEFFYRAGGFACVNSILEEPLMVHISAAVSTQMERQQGYAAIILEKNSFTWHLCGGRPRYLRLMQGCTGICQR